MPGLIDAHTHMSAPQQIRAMLQNGVTATCDVGGSAGLAEHSKQLSIISSAGMTMGTLSGKAYVKKAIEGRPDRQIADTINIKWVWVNGQSIA